MRTMYRKGVIGWIRAVRVKRQNEKTQDNIRPVVKKEHRKNQTVIRLRMIKVVQSLPMDGC